MSKENEWEDDPDMQEFLEWADQPGPWDEEDDKIHTVGGLTNDKKNGFMSFINKTKMSKDNNLRKSKPYNRFSMSEKGYSEAKAYLEEIGEWDYVSTHGFSTDGWSIIATANSIWDNRNKDE